MPSVSPAYTLSVYNVNDAAGIARWQHLSGTSPQHSPFTNLIFAGCLSQRFAINLQVWLVADHKRDVAGMLVFHQTQGPFHRITVPAFMPYTSVLLADEDVQQDALTFLTNQLATRFDDARLHLHPTIQDIRPFTWAGWQTTPYYTYTLDLLSLDNSFSSWSNGTRRNFNKNKDAYSLSETPQALQTVVTLCASGYERNGRQFPILPEKLVSLASDLQAKSMVRCFTVVNEAGTTEAGLAVLHHGTQAYYWIAGSNPGPAMTVLLGKTLPKLQAAGIETFDFVGANTPGIAEFKRRFGAILTPYFGVTHTPNQLLNTLLRAKRLISG